MTEHPPRIRIIIGIALLCSLVWYTRLDAKLTFDSTKPTLDFKRIQGKASWYSEQSPGINLRTANNEIFDDREMTCAIWGVPFNKLIRVTNLATGKSIIVRVNDRGPHYRFVRQGRVVDLTKTAFARLSSLHHGLINVQLEFLN